MKKETIIKLSKSFEESSCQEDGLPPEEDIRKLERRVKADGKKLLGTGSK